MRIRSKAVLVALSLVFLGVLPGATLAQTIQFSTHEIALKNGESTELAQVFYIGLNCQSLLKSTPTVEILDGPPGVTATIVAADVVPRSVSCAKPVAGGRLIIKAQDVQEHSYTRMVLRINYKTLNGDRQRAENINIALFPAI